MSTRHRPPAGRSLRHVGETRLNSPMTVDRAQVARTPVAVGPPGPPGVDASAGPHVPTHLAGGSDPLPWVDLPEGIPADPPIDHARLYALDVNGYTQVEMRDGAAKVVRFASDNVLIGKVTEPTGVARGACVYLAGATGANPEVRLARADDLATMSAIGLALDAGVLNGFIRVLIGGTLALLNTSAFAEGDRLYVSPTTAGAMTTTLPLAPAFAQRVGFVTRSHATQGELLVLTTGVVTPPRLHHETHEPGGTDALVNAAWTNVANVFTASQTIGHATSALLQFNETGQPADQRLFGLYGAAGKFFVHALTDAGGSAATPYSLSRTGILSVPAGVEFPVTAVNVTNPNTLDDYEEGTWTPTLGGASGQSGQVYSSQTGAYTKIGRMVTVWYALTVSTVGTITGALEVQGLPFTASVNLVGGTGAVQWATFATTWVNVQMIVFPGTTVARLRGAPTAIIGNVVAVGPADLQSGSSVAGTVTYFV